MSHMASTAAGVTVGSAVGHTLGAAILGGHHAERTESAPYQVPADQQFQQQVTCQRELREFLECSQTQADLSFCNRYNEALKECQRRFGRNI